MASASALEFFVQERDVERRVVDDELGVADELAQLRQDVRKARLAAQELGREAVHLHRARIDLTVGTQVAMKLPAGTPPVHDLDRADLDDAMAKFGLEARRLGVEKDLAHGMARPVLT